MSRTRQTLASFSGMTTENDILCQEMFWRTLALERKRTERSKRGFLLMLLESASLLRGDQNNAALGKIISRLSGSTRETDVKGWYAEGSTIGVIFTEIGAAGGGIGKTLLAKITRGLQETLDVEEMQAIHVSIHAYPEDGDNDHQSRPTGLNTLLYPDFAQNACLGRVPLRIKRLIDIAGALMGLLLCLPVLALIATCIKLTSRGPVFFRQRRLGRFGDSFTLLKFRSMYVENDHALHKQFVTDLIAKRPRVGGASSNQPPIFKLVDDPRITSIGKILRKTSLDELPQLINVLMGDMSLVGPRPPLPYEFEIYEMWHKRRLLAVKPGITGLWQVRGRSRVTFDDMVRLDLQYVASWCIWLDLKLLLETPRAVITGNGAR